MQNNIDNIFLFRSLLLEDFAKFEGITKNYKQRNLKKVIKVIFKKTLKTRVMNNEMLLWHLHFYLSNYRKTIFT